LFEIDPAGLAILEFECNAPRSIDVNRIASRIEPMQRMKIKAWDVHFLSPDGDIKTVESGKDALMHFCVDLRTLALGPQLRKGFVFEGSDHAINVSS
jgi:hypothetical protein